MKKLMGIKSPAVNMQKNDKVKKTKLVMYIKKNCFQCNQLTV